MASTAAVPAAVPAIPPFGKMNMHAILFEGVLWGMNVVIFSSCIYVLKKRMRSASWLLTGGTTLLFCLSTAHFVISWFTLVQAFTQAPNNLTPLGPDLYFARLNSPLAVAQAEIYIFNVWGQDLLLIWRLYMVLGRNWKVVVIPLIIEAVHIACAFLSIGLLARPGANLFSPTIQAWGKASWSLDLILNTSLTCVIAFYLWRAGRETASLTRTGRNKYTETVLTIVESGAIYAIATLVIFALDIAGDPAGFVGVSGVIQLATLTPLLIVVRVGLGLTRDNTTFHTSQIPSTLVTSQPYSGIHVNISKNTESRIDSAYGMKTMSSVGQHSTIVGDVRGDDKV